MSLAGAGAGAAAGEAPGTGSLDLALQAKMPLAPRRRRVRNRSRFMHTSVLDGVFERRGVSRLVSSARQIGQSGALEHLGGGVVQVFEHQADAARATIF